MKIIDVRMVVTAILLMSIAWYAASMYASQERAHNVLDTRDAITDSAVATNVAYDVLCGIYGKQKIDRELPLIAGSDGEFWTICGTLNGGNSTRKNEAKMDVGGVAIIVMRKKNGEIIRISHGK